MTNLRICKTYSGYSSFSEELCLVIFTKAVTYEQLWISVENERGKMMDQFYERGQMMGQFYERDQMMGQFYDKDQMIGQFYERGQIIGQFLPVICLLVGLGVPLRL